MGFSTKQVRALRRELDSRKIRTRQVNGRELSYIEGWHAIAEANRIFGPDGWSRETIETRCVLSRETRGSFLAIYAAKVRITVFANGRTVVREGHGTGEGHGNSAAETHDIALKAAETDATKRALATFGKPFGLSLYLVDRGRTEGNERRQLFSPRYRPTPSAVIPPVPAEPASEKELEIRVPEPRSAGSDCRSTKRENAARNLCLPCRPTKLSRRKADCHLESLVAFATAITSNS